jgi:hypothetical protein
VKTPYEAIKLAKEFTSLDTAALVLVNAHVGQQLRQLVTRLRGPTAEQPDRLAVASLLEGLVTTIHHAEIHRPAEVVLTRFAAGLAMIADAGDAAGKGGGQ